MAVGGGFEIMISADLIIAAEHARFALPEIKVGVLADAATIKLRRRIPYHIAAEMLLTGRWMDTAEASHWGLINEVLPADQVLPRARELAALLAGGPPLIFAAIKDCPMLQRVLRAVMVWFDSITRTAMPPRSLWSEIGTGGARRQRLWIRWTVGSGWPKYSSTREPMPTSCWWMATGWWIRKIQRFPKAAIRSCGSG
jgi:hypothetical protein